MRFFTGLAALMIGANIFAATTPAYRDTTLSIDQRVDDLLSRMTLHEKVLQLQNNSTSSISDIPGHYRDGGTGTVHDMSLPAADAAVLFDKIQHYHMDSTRLGIPALISVEGIHGVLQNNSTIFPQAIAQSTTWNPELIREMGAAIGEEAKLMGISQLLSPVFDLARELRWGRVEETFGEDPFLISQIGTAFVNGVQSRGVGCMPKHFVAHGTPTGGLNCAAVEGGERQLRNLYAYPFARVIRDGKPIAIMGCYSSYDGVPVCGSRYYMTDFLRGELGFDGFVYSDWGSVDRLKVFHSAVSSTEDAGRQALMAGIDMDVWDWAYSTLEQQVLDGKLDESYIDEACRRILKGKFRLGLFDHPYGEPDRVADVVRSPAHKALSRRVADESAVLLQNNGILPLDKKKYKKIALLGPNSDITIFGDYGWVSSGHHEGITLKDGLQAKGLADVRQLDGCDWWSQDTTGIADAAKLAAESDLAVVAVGTRSFWLGRNAKGEKVTSGEGFDLSSLELPGKQLELLKAVKATGKPMVVVLITGKPLVMSWVKDNADALLVQFYAGEEQGASLADILYGDVNPSGRLTVSFPRSTGNTPCFYNYNPGDREQVFDKGGSLEEPNGHYVFDKPYALYPFGAGESYTTFDYLDATLEKDTFTLAEANDAFGPHPAKAGANPQALRVKVHVRNTGDRPGKETVQLYMRDMVSTINTPVKQLKAFKKVDLQPGETAEVVLEIPLEELAFYNGQLQRVIEPGDFELYVAHSSDDVRHTLPFKVVP